jgi:predicted MFS family arabinose efflux permease
MPVADRRPNVEPLDEVLDHVRGPARAAYGLAAGVIGLGLFASLTPSPLYHAYSSLWHFSQLTLTLIYATYAFGVLATLLLAGGVSDQVGRRPVLITALAGLMGATVLFLVADSAAWLFRSAGSPAASRTSCCSRCSRSQSPARTSCRSRRATAPHSG